MDTNYTCPSCEEEILHRAPIDGRLAKTGHIHCTMCGEYVKPDQWRGGLQVTGKAKGRHHPLNNGYWENQSSKKKAVADNKRRSQEQEKGAAKRYQGKAQPASGALDGAKGDVLTPLARGECKFTRARSFRLKLDELLKIEKESRGTEIPFMEIEFQGVFPVKRYVVIEASSFEAITGELSDKDD